VPERAEGDAAPASQENAFLHNLLLFGRLLHGLGLEVNPGRMIDVQEALREIQIGRKADFFYTLRSFLVKRREDLPLFDEAFALFWRKPVDDVWEIDLAQLLADRQPPRPESLPVILPQPDADKAESSASDDEQTQEVIELTRTYSERELLRQQDFAHLTREEFLAIKQMMAELIWRMSERTTRRYTPGRDGLIDIRRSLRRNLRHGGELLIWSYRTPKIKPRPLIILADISGSMEAYTRLLLHFMYGVTNGLRRRVEVFVFGTRLTRITRQLRRKNVDQALDDVTAVVKDWSGGTRMGDALKTFNYVWGRRVLRGEPVVLLISDGWDRGDPLLLDKEIGRLHRFCHRLVWLNPLLGSENYEPLTRGMQAALPHLDDFLPVHNLASLEELAFHLSQLDEKRRPLRTTTQVRGAAFVGGGKTSWKK
jgi:hypothetical protein